MRRDACSSHPRGESGSILYAVIALVFLLSLVGMALFKMTTTSGNVAVGSSRTTGSIRHIDSALELALNRVRADDTNPCPPPAPSTSMLAVSGYADPQDADPATLDVTCQGSEASGERILDFQAMDGTKVVGRAKVRVIDHLDNGLPLRGQGVEVCDWLIGGGTVHDCP
jgi:hypothetical protein